jgi:hypothetical protein
MITAEDFLVFLVVKALELVLGVEMTLYGSVMV